MGLQSGCEASLKSYEADLDMNIVERRNVA